MLAASMGGAPGALWLLARRLAVPGWKRWHRDIHPTRPALHRGTRGVADRQGLLACDAAEGRLSPRGRPSSAHITGFFPAKESHGDTLAQAPDVRCAGREMFTLLSRFCYPRCPSRDRTTEVPAESFASGASRVRTADVMPVVSEDLFDLGTTRTAPYDESRRTTNAHLQHRFDVLLLSADGTRLLEHRRHLLDAPPAPPRGP